MNHFKGEFWIFIGFFKGKKDDFFEKTRYV